MPLDLNVLLGTIQGFAEAQHAQNLNQLNQTINQRNLMAQMYESMYKDETLPQEQRDNALQLALGIRQTPYTEKLGSQYSPQGAMKFLMQNRRPITYQHLQQLFGPQEPSQGQPGQGQPGPGAQAAPGTSAPGTPGGAAAQTAPAPGPFPFLGLGPTPGESAPGVPIAATGGPQTAGATPGLLAATAPAPNAPPDTDFPLTLHRQPEEAIGMGMFQKEMENRLGMEKAFGEQRGKTAGEYGDLGLVANRALPDILKAVAEPKTTALPPGSGYTQAGGLDVVDRVLRSYGLPGLAAITPAPVPGTPAAAGGGGALPTGVAAPMPPPTGAAPTTATTGPTGQAPVVLPSGATYYPPGPFAKSDALQADDRAFMSALHTTNNDALIPRILQTPGSERLGYAQILDQYMPDVPAAMKQQINDATEEAKVAPSERKARQMTAQEKEIQLETQKGALAPENITNEVDSVLRDPGYFFTIKDQAKRERVASRMNEIGAMQPKELTGDLKTLAGTSFGAKTQVDQISGLLREAEYPSNPKDKPIKAEELLGPIMGRWSELQQKTGLNLFPGNDRDSIRKSQLASQLVSAFKFLTQVEIRQQLPGRPASQWMQALSEATAHPEYALPVLQGALKQELSNAYSGMKRVYHGYFNVDPPWKAFGPEKAGTNGKEMGPGNVPGFKPGYPKGAMVAPPNAPPGTGGGAAAQAAAGAAARNSGPPRPAGMLPGLGKVLTTARIQATAKTLGVDYETARQAAIRDGYIIAP